MVGHQNGQTWMVPSGHSGRCSSERRMASSREVVSGRSSFRSASSSPAGPPGFGRQDFN